MIALDTFLTSVTKQATEATQGSRFRELMSVRWLKRLEPVAEVLKPRPNQEAETIYAASETRQPHVQKFPQSWKTRLSGRAHFQIHKPVGDIFLFNLEQ